MTDVRSTFAGANAVDPPDRPVAFTAVQPVALTWLTIVSSGVVVAAVMAMPWSPIGRAFGEPGRLNDYAAHIENAEALTRDGITFPHFLWHGLVIAVHEVSAWSWVNAAKFVVIGSYGLQGAVLAWAIVTLVAAPRRPIDMLGVICLALLLVVVAPITVLTWHEGALYHGYLNMESYGSPTYALLKPLALIVFVYVGRAFFDRRWPRDGIILGTATVASALAKPNLLICLLPTTLVIWVLRRHNGHAVRSRYLVAAFLLPSAALLAWQYLIYFGSPAASSFAVASGERSTVMFAPLLVMGRYATWLGPKLLLSVLFPLTVLLVYPRHVVASSTMQLAWVQFVFGVFCTYMLAESRAPLSGNFAWTGQVAAYVLFVSSAIFAQRAWTGGWRSIVCLTVFGFHAICGFVFFLFPYNWGPACAPGTCAPG